MQTQAARTARSLIKCRARTYAGRPIDLDAIVPGLSSAPPEILISVGADLLQVERHAPRRWFGFGGETPAINARALVLLGRALRRSRR
ncbi:MAG: hypothetical protein WDN46_20690 [Methylocella sp.]